MFRFRSQFLIEPRRSRTLMRYALGALAVGAITYLGNPLLAMLFHRPAIPSAPM